MSAQDEIKRKGMDAVSHRETVALMRKMKFSPIPRQAIRPLAVVTLAAIAAPAAAQIGWAKTAVGAGVYVGKIREADRERQTTPAPTRQGPRTVYRTQGFERL